MPITPAKAYEGEICVVCYGYGCNFSATTLVTAYEAAVQTFTDAGVAPNRLANRGKWGSFRHKHPHLMRSDFSDIRFLSLSHRLEGEEYSERALAYVSLQPEWKSFDVCWLPSLIGKPAALFHELFKKLAIVSDMRYGVQGWRRMIVPQPFYTPPDGSLEAEWADAASYWWPSKPEQANSLLLRGVSPSNYLSQPYLDAPFGLTGLSLREWIEANPVERGSLAPFTDNLTQWSPPAENIPRIREELFRAGRLFYHRFFRELDYERVVSKRGEIAIRSELPWKRDSSFIPITYPPEPFYRPNIHEPWEATGPTPDIFQAARYHELFQDTRPT